MVQHCVACNIIARRGLNASFHSFPTDPALRKKWIKATGRTDFEPSEHSRICSNHFKKDDFNINFGRKTLKPNVVPCVFDKDVVARKRTRRSTRNLVETQPSPPESEEIEASSSANEISQIEENPQPKKVVYLIINNNGKVASPVDAVSQPSKVTTVNNVTPVKASIAPTNGTIKTSPKKISLICTPISAQRLPLLQTNNDTVTNSACTMPIITSTETVQDLSMEDESLDQEETLQIESEPIMPTKRRRSVPVYMSDVTIEDLTDPTKIRRIWEIANNTVERQRKTISDLRLTVLKERKRVKTLCQLIDKVKAAWTGDPNVDPPSEITEFNSKEFA